MILVLAVLVSQSRGGDVRDVERIKTNCTLYTQNDIQTAMDIVEKEFQKGFEGCKLLTITYDEEETQKEIERQWERYGELKLLILVSDFYAGEKAEGGFERDMTYTGWKWIFRDDGDGWRLINWGYA